MNTDDDDVVELDEEIAELGRRLELSKQRVPLEAEARLAQERGDHGEAVLLWTRARALALEGGEETTVWYIDGQAADALIKATRNDEAIDLLSTSIAAGNDLPFALRMLVDLLVENGRMPEAVRVQQQFWKGRKGAHAPDLSPQIVGFAKRWKSTGSTELIDLAEQWAIEAEAREALFAVKHERASMREKAGDAHAALSLYLELVQAGSSHEATYTRAMILLERAKQQGEALALARSAIGRGFSASFEEQTNKRIASLESKAAGVTAKKRSADKPKALVPAFSIRSGVERVRLLRQVEVKGGIASALFRSDGIFAISRSPQALWSIPNNDGSATNIRAVPKRSTLHAGVVNAIISERGTVADGETRVALLDTGWATRAEVVLPGVTSQVATTRWGFAIGCRTGGLYALDWSGEERWRFDVPALAGPSGGGRACPYLVDCADGGATIVFSSFADVYALRDSGQVAWKWELPPPPAKVLGAILSVQMLSGSVSAVRATRDGGAYIASQGGQIYRLDSSGRLVWNGDVQYSTVRILLDSNDELVALVHSNGLSLRKHSGELETVIEGRWPAVTRSVDGRLYAAVESNQLTVVADDGAIVARLDFSKSISDVSFSDTSRGVQMNVAAGKVVTLALSPP